MCFVKISDIPDNEKEGVGYKMFRIVKNEKNREILYNTQCIQADEIRIMEEIS